MNSCVIKYKGSVKYLHSETYNYIFNMRNGFFARWGETKYDDPDFSPFGPEIADIEVSTICNVGCPWCYKENNGEGVNMPLTTFKKVFSRLPPTLTQIAFGIGDVDGNPDLWSIFTHCLKNRVIPNITINGKRFNSDLATKLVRCCGAVAVSHYDNDECFDAVQLLSKQGLHQVNIHQLVAESTYDDCFNLLENVRKDKRLKNLNAIVFLALKQKGRGKKMKPMQEHKFTKLINEALERNISIGFDSCSANKFLRATSTHPRYQQFKMMAEPCESACFSQYINVEGIAYPCSFIEGQKSLKGINLLHVQDFLKEVWYSQEVKSFREKLLKRNRNCPEFDI